MRRTATTSDIGAVRIISLLCALLNVYWRGTQRRRAAIAAFSALTFILSQLTRFALWFECFVIALSGCEWRTESVTETLKLLLLLLRSAV
jgi:hypothetical protein